MARLGHVERLGPTVGGFEGSQRHTVNGSAPACVSTLSQDEGADCVDVAVDAQLGRADGGRDATR